MELSPGKELLQYRLAEKIGEGGMGAVWRATDTTLDREVAIKILPAVFAQDRERRARFEREAKLLASLNHPNLAAIYGLHEADGVFFIAMELVPGEDLAQRLARGSVPIDEALAIAGQLCEALQAAHDRDVIHRDLKPANILLTPEGRVKVLDFGLARGPEAPASGASLDASPTVTSAGSTAGMILGTAAYMSPEQARAKPLDRRSDIWSFGCVLYEMLTGRRVFAGETITDILSAVISREPDWSLLPADTPEATRRLLWHCLEKDVNARRRDAADVRLALSEDADPPAWVTAGRESENTSLTAGSSPKPGRLATILAAGSLVVMLTILAMMVLRSSGPDEVAPSLAELPTARQVTFTGDVNRIDLASDGRTAVYLASDRRSVILLDLDGGGRRTLYTSPAGETLDTVWFSPDGDRVYLEVWPYASRVFSIPRLGGEPRNELNLEHLAGLNQFHVRRIGERWLLGGNANTLYVGDDPAGLTASGTRLVGDGVFEIPGLASMTAMRTSGDGRWLAYLGEDDEGQESTGVTSTVPDGSTKPTSIGVTAAPIGWSNDDRHLYLIQRTGSRTVDLLRQTIDPRTGTPLGPPATVYTRIEGRTLRVSQDGQRAIFITGARVTNLLEITLDGTPNAADNPRRVRTDGTGRWGLEDFFPGGELLASLQRDEGEELLKISGDGARTSITSRSTRVRSASVSPDGKTIALVPDETAPTVVLYDIENGRSREIDLPEPASTFAWSPDASHLAGMTADSADRMLAVDVVAGTAKAVTLDCGTRCQFAYEGVVTGPEWPWAAITSEVDTWIVNVETGALRHLATDTWNITAWQGNWIYFARGGGQTDWPGYVLFRIPAEGGQEERLLDLPPECAYVVPAPDGRSVVCPFDESKYDLRVIDGFDRGL